MLEEEPLVSIIMTAYNEEKYIAEAIESILSQTYQSFELLIINDGSKDRTEEIILSFNDSRIKYIKNEINLKLIASLNKGLGLANGKYIARMDADDICLPERLQKQIYFMENHPEIGISGAQLIVFGSEDSTMNYPIEHEDLLLRLLVTSCFPNNLVIFRKAIMDQHHLRFPEGYLHAEDYKFWTQWLFITKGYNLNNYLVKYRFHGASVSQAHKQVQRETRNKIRKEYLQKLFLFEPAKQQIVDDFYSFNIQRRIKACDYVLKANFERKIVNPKKLIQVISFLWYSDFCEEFINKNLNSFDFAKILKFDFSFYNLKNLMYIIKADMKRLFLK